MFFLRSHYSHPEFRAGARDMWPQAPGIAAWGLMTGVAMVQSGMSTVEALAMTLLVFAGSSQLASLPLIAAGRLRPVIDSVHDFDAIADAHRLMEANANTGKIVVRILKGEKAGDIAPQLGDKTTLTVNPEAAKKQGAPLSPALLKEAKDTVK